MNGVEWAALRPSRFTPEETVPVLVVQEGGWVQEAVWTFRRKQPTTTTTTTTTNNNNNNNNNNKLLTYMQTQQSWSWDPTLWKWGIYGDKRCCMLSSR